MTAPPPPVRGPLASFVAVEQLAVVAALRALIYPLDNSTWPKAERPGRL